MFHSKQQIEDYFLILVCKYNDTILTSEVRELYIFVEIAHFKKDVLRFSN